MITNENIHFDYTKDPLPENDNSESGSTRKAPDPRPKPSPDSHSTQTGGAGPTPFQTPESEKMTLKKLHSLLPGAQKRLDGYLTNIPGRKTPTMLYAVEKMSAEDARKLREHFKFYNSINRSFVFMADCSVIGDYTCFEFSLFHNEYSLRDFCKEKPAYMKHYPLMKNLVCFIADYYSHLEKMQQYYKPLLSLSLDTVFIDTQGSLRVLPLMSYRNNWPKEAPRDVDTVANETTDLYSAAMLALEVGCDDLEHPSMDQLLGNPILQRILLPFPSLRPSLQEVINHFSKNVHEIPKNPYSGSSAGAASGFSASAPHRAPASDSAGKKIKVFWSRFKDFWSKFNLEEKESTFQKGGTAKVHTSGPAPIHFSGLHTEVPDDNQ